MWSAHVAKRCRPHNIPGKWVVAFQQLGKKSESESAWVSDIWAANLIITYKRIRSAISIKEEPIIWTTHTSTRTGSPLYGTYMPDCHCTIRPLAKKKKKRKARRYAPQFLIDGMDASRTLCVCVCVHCGRPTEMTTAIRPLCTIPPAQWRHFPHRVIRIPLHFSSTICAVGRHVWYRCWRKRHTDKRDDNSLDCNTSSFWLKRQRVRCK